MGRLRVIAGRAHGRRLVVPRGGRTRPTSGLVRGPLFDVLVHRGWCDDARGVDLFVVQRRRHGGTALTLLVSGEESS